MVFDDDVFHRLNDGLSMPNLTIVQSEDDDVLPQLVGIDADIQSPQNDGAGVHRMLLPLGRDQARVAEKKTPVPAKDHGLSENGMEHDRLTRHDVF